MNDSQRIAFGRYLTTHHRAEDIKWEPLRLALVIAGERPAAALTVAPWEFPYRNRSPDRCLCRLLALFDIAYRRVWADQWFIAADPDRLALIPPERTTENDAYHRRLGQFFGYPQDAVEAFLPIQTRSPYPRDLVADGSVTATQIAYTRFVPYVLDDSCGGYDRAITAGKAIYERLCELAHEWELAVLATLAETAYADAVAVYSGKEGSFIPVRHETHDGQ